ncbi:MAG TPA: zinc ribbon domain-containing protein, partial [Longilinea sp.]|nr:zinc ribbon domain-containing protein [Longilinea sp.]
MSEPLRGPITQYHPHQCPHCRFYTHPMLCKAFGTQGAFGEMLASLEDESSESCPRFLLDYDRLGTPPEPATPALTPDQTLAQQDPANMPSGKVKDCPSCGQSIPQEAQVCGYCGATFKVLIGGFCTHCRKVVLGGEEGLCPICGSALIERQYHSTRTASINETTGAIFQQTKPGDEDALLPSIFSGEGVQDC